MELFHKHVKISSAFFMIKDYNIQFTMQTLENMCVGHGHVIALIYYLNIFIFMPSMTTAICICVSVRVCLPVSCSWFSILGWHYTCFTHEKFIHFKPLWHVWDSEHCIKHFSNLLVFQSRICYACLGWRWLCAGTKKLLIEIYSKISIKKKKQMY